MADNARAGTRVRCETVPIERPLASRAVLSCAPMSMLVPHGSGVEGDRGADRTFEHSTCEAGLLMDEIVREAAEDESAPEPVPQPIVEAVPVSLEAQPAVTRQVDPRYVRLQR